MPFLNAQDDSVALSELERVLSSAVNAYFSAGARDARQFLSTYFASDAGTDADPLDSNDKAVATADPVAIADPLDSDDKAVATADSVATADPLDSDDKTGAGDAWTASKWLASIGVARVVAQVLLARGGSGSELEAMQELSASDVAHVSTQLTEGGVAGMLAAAVCREGRDLASTDGLTGQQLHSKFASDGADFTLQYGGLETFYGGLEGAVGSPDPKIWPAMEREHTSEADADAVFTASNYGLTTTPRDEWAFVVAPGRRWAEERTGQLHRRQPMLVTELEARVKARSDELQLLGEPALLLTEALGGRLYTGPMFVKYNDLLRGFGPNLAGCLGNRYVTTTHVINSCLVKTSKLTRAAKVYRGVTGGLLPDAFWKPNAQNVRGGVERAFLSMTLERSVAMQYASRPGKPGVIFEAQMGMVDRGAELGWLSQCAQLWLSIP